MYEVFEKLLQEKGVKVVDVARATGIRSGVFSDWKSGRYTPKADKLQKIADYFGVSLAYLMTGKQDTECSPNEKAATIGQYVLKNKELRLLVEASEGSEPDDLRMARDLLERLKTYRCKIEQIIKAGKKEG